MTLVFDKEAVRTVPEPKTIGKLTQRIAALKKEQYGRRSVFNDKENTFASKFISPLEVKLLALQREQATKVSRAMVESVGDVNRWLKGYENDADAPDKAQVMERMRRFVTARFAATVPIELVDSPPASLGDGMEQRTHDIWAFKDSKRAQAWWGQEDGPLVEEARVYTALDPFSPRSTRWNSGTGVSIPSKVGLIERTMSRVSNRENALVCRPWRLLVEAFDAGAYMVWFVHPVGAPYAKKSSYGHVSVERGTAAHLPSKVVVCLAPKTVHVEGRRLHHPNGPAAVWGDGNGSWFWKGQPIEAKYMENKDLITWDLIASQTNEETRQAYMDIIGPKRFMEIANPVVAHEDIDRQGNKRRLLRIAGQQATTTWGSVNTGPDYVAVEVKCPSTGDQYLLRVPPQAQTCYEAVAWTQGHDFRWVSGAGRESIPLDAFDPVVET